MQTLDVRYFGESSIQYNGRDLFLPYAKAEETLFVLLHEKQMARLKLCDLVWDLEECDEERAKTNLRHAIYTIRKQCSGDLIQSPRRDTVRIGEGFTIRSDLDLLLGYDPAACDGDTIRRFLSDCGEPFLHACRSAGTKLELWIDAHTQAYQQLYVRKLRQTITHLLDGNELETAERCCRRLLVLEEYDEPACVTLMEIYQKTGQYTQALEVYQQLETRLREELSVKPLPETTEIYLNVKRSSIRQKKNDGRAELYGRSREMSLLRGHFRQFAQQTPFSHCLISGEAGIGKTTLLKAFLGEQVGGCLVLDLCCYELEESFMLRFWDRVLDALAAYIVERGCLLPAGLARDIAHVFPTFHAWSDTEGDSGRSSPRDLPGIDKNICALFGVLHKQYGLQVLVAVDDLQWIDDDSLRLLSKVLFTNPSAVMLVASHREERSKKLQRFYYHLGVVEHIRLARFSEEQTRQFILQACPEMNEQAGEIHRYSEGNLLFLVEIINNIRENILPGSITDKMARLVEGRILRLNADAQKLLAVCSMFYDAVAIHTLTALVDFSDSALMDAVEELVQKNILLEMVATDGTIQLCFTHTIIRQYVYDNMPRAKRLLMHSRIAKYYETLLRGVRLDRVTYPKLIHHYEKAENREKLFAYKLKRMQSVFNVCHELFPVLEAGQDEGLFDEYSNESILNGEFQQLRRIYEEIEAVGAPDTMELRILFLHLYGRFCNGSGNLPVALETLTTLMALSAGDPRYEQYYFRGAVLLVQYAINTGNRDMMRQNIERALQTAERIGDVGYSALACRHLGYYYILQGAYEKGEAMLDEARRRFETPDDRQAYKLHIAATYFFKGESRCRQEQYKQALDYYKKTLALCNVDANLTSAAVLFLRLGYIHHRMGEQDRAMEYLSRSIAAYERIIFIWGRADAYYYLHKVCEQKGLSDMSRKNAKIAEQILSSHKFKLSI